MKPDRITLPFSDPGDIKVEIDDCDEVYGEFDPNTLTFDIDDLCEHEPEQSLDGIIRCCKCHEVLGFARSNMCGDG